MADYLEIGKYTTEDGKTVHEGDLVYDYYTMEPVDIGPAIERFEGWFRTYQPGSLVASEAKMLNGQRIYTLEYAVRRGFPGAQQALDDHNDLQRAKREAGI